MKKKILALSLLTGAAALAGQPGVVNFSWAPSPEPNTGYYFSYGSGSVGGSNVVAKIDTGSSTNYALTNLTAGVYWVQTSAHDATWKTVESAATNTVSFTVPSAPGALRIQ